MQPAFASTASPGIDRGRDPRDCGLRDDVKALLKLASNRTPAQRRSLFDAIVELLERDHARLSGTERKLMADIIARLINDVAMDVRRSLAERLAGQDDAPHDLILLLANDSIEVAEPVLIASAALGDSDLIRIVREKTKGHRLCVAARPQIGTVVSDALVESGELDVITVLLGNETARIGEASFNRIIEQSRDDQALQAPLVRRADLPRALADKLYVWTSDAIREVICARFAMDEAEVAALLKDAVRDMDTRVHVQGPDQENGESPNARLVEKLYDGQQLSAGFLIKCLNSGQYEMFELGFAKLVNLTVDVFRKVIYNRSPDALALACRVVGIDRSAFPSILKAVAHARDGTSEPSLSETEHALDIFKRMDRRKAEITLHRWAADESRAPIF